MPFTSIIISVAFAFLVTYVLTPKLKTFLEDAGLVGTDVQKHNKPRIAEMGGPAVVFGIIAGVFLFVWINTFLYGQNTNLVGLLAAITTFIIAGFIGIFDDLGSLIKKRESKEGLETFKRIGLKQWQKPLLTIAAAIPLMSVMAGVTTITVPLVGTVNIGILYPLVLIPVAVVGAANALNMLAGVNGLEAGAGSVLMLFLGIFAYIHGQPDAAVLALVTMGSLLAFLVFNWYPSRIFPGDSLPYAVGAIAASVAILGNIEKFALFLFVPWFIELLLKARSRFKAQSFGMLQPDGTLKAPYEKSYSLTHVVMKLGKFKEWQVSAIIILGIAAWSVLIFLISIA